MPPKIDGGPAAPKWFRASHQEVGAFQLSYWGLPTGVIEAVAYHHEPAKVPQQEFGTLGAVHVADVLAHRLLYPRQPPPVVDKEYLTRLGVNHLLPRWLEMAKEELEKPE